MKLAPQIISLSRDLLKRARSTEPGQNLVRASNPEDLADRITALEENERRQAELLNQMAQQQAELSLAVVTLHRRQRWLTGAVVALGIALLWQIFRP